MSDLASGLCSSKVSLSLITVNVSEKRIYSWSANKPGLRTCEVRQNAGKGRFSKANLLMPPCESYLGR